MELTGSATQKVKVGAATELWEASESQWNGRGRWAEHPPSLTTLRRAIRAGSKSTDQSWQFLQTAEDVVRFFIVLAWVDKPPVGDGDDAHLRRFGRGDARKRVLNHKACVGGETEFVRRAQIDVGSGFAAFNFFASNNDFETSGQFMSI